MKEGNLDNILKKIENRHQGVLKKVEMNLKGTRPFAQVKLTPQKKLEYLNDLTPSDIADLMREFTPETVMRLFHEVANEVGGLKYG